MAPKNPCQGKHREFGNFAKTQGKHREFGCSSCKFPDSKSKRYFGICCENFQICIKKICFFPPSWITLPCQFCVCNSHKSHKFTQGKFAAGLGKKKGKSQGTKGRWKNLTSGSPGQPENPTGQPKSRSQLPSQYPSRA